MLPQKVLLGTVYYTDSLGRTHQAGKRSHEFQITGFSTGTRRLEREAEFLRTDAEKAELCIVKRDPQSSSSINLYAYITLSSYFKSIKFTRNLKSCGLCISYNLCITTT